MSTPTSAHDDGLFPPSACGARHPRRHRPPFVPHAQRRHRRGGGDDRHHLDARSARRAGREGSGQQPKLGATHLARPGRREEVQRPGDDRAGRVLQGRPRPLEFAHHRADAHHLRLLPALHEAAGRPTGAGHRAEGPPLRQPERHRQGPRHRARLAGGPDGQGAGHGGSAVPRRDDRQAGRRPTR